MKRKIIILILLLVIHNCYVVHCGEMEFEESEIPQIRIQEANIDNDWDFYVNNEKLENNNILISADILYSTPYIALRSFIEEVGENISWDKETNNIIFTFNRNKYLITSSDENCVVRTMPSFFDIRYVRIKNLTINEDIVISGSDTIPIYIMNNSSYINSSILSEIAKMSNCDCIFSMSNKLVSIKKYNYDKDFIVSKINKYMTYSEIIGYLGTNDYFELLEKGGCKVRYNIDMGYIEMVFTSYTDESDMKLVSAYLFDKYDNEIDEVIK